MSPPTMPEATFPAAAMREQRRRADEYRRRAKVLEAALIKAAVNDAFATSGLPEAERANVPLDGVSVDERGAVHGVASAIRALCTAVHGRHRPYP